MRKSNYLILLFGIVMTVSCTKKESSPPSAAESNALLLAGAQGGGKTWKLVSISESANGGAPATVTASSGIPSCESDNLFVFYHNSNQGYQQMEGSTTCADGDPTTVESGSWAFSEDGKSLFIEASVFPQSTQFQNETPPDYFLFYFILSIGKPVTVTSITATSMTITYSGSYTDSNTGATVNYVDTLIFNSTN